MFSQLFPPGNTSSLVVGGQCHTLRLHVFLNGEMQKRREIFFLLLFFFTRDPFMLGYLIVDLDPSFILIECDFYHSLDYILILSQFFYRHNKNCSNYSGKHFQTPKSISLHTFKFRRNQHVPLFTISQTWCRR